MNRARALLTFQRRFSSSAKRCMDLEHKYSTHNYHPLPVVLSRASGVHMWTADGKRYIDGLAAYGAVNQGHGHPKIVAALKEQVDVLCLTSRAFHNDKFGETCEFLCKFFGFDRALMMNTGIEACESAIKIARRWGYEKKGIPENQARVIFCNDNFWGRSITAVSSSTDPDAYTNYGPFTPGFTNIPFGDLDALEKELKDPNVCAFMCEPIQGEAGIMIPHDGYLKGVRELCDRHNVLWIADEVQSGCGRSGTLLAVDHENVKPDLVTMAKAISGGVYPVSCVLGKEEAMSVLTPGTHGSTYGGNPLACHIVKAALNVIKNEKLVQNSKKKGERLRRELKKTQKRFPEIIKDIRGRGLMNAIEIHENSPYTAMELCLEFAEHGFLAKPTHNTIIRITPPLVLKNEDVDEIVQIVNKSFDVKF